MGDPRPDFALADLFGAHLIHPPDSYTEAIVKNQAGETFHTYLRLLPELRAQVDGPQTGTEPLINGERHRVLLGFDETDILAFGGLLKQLKTDPGTEIPMTFIPQFPIYPPETAWMREPKTDIPGLVLNNSPSGSRIAFLPADIDRQFGRYNLPDHGNLLANIIRWAAGDDFPLSVNGPGLVDFHLYRQSERVILHMVNLTSAGTWRQPVDELIPVGPLQVRLKLPDQLIFKNVNLIVSGLKIKAVASNGWITFDINTILDHEVAIIT